MRYLSVCSGIEAATVAWHHLGWKPTAFSEIDAFPSEVLAHHFPDVPNLGDMTEISDEALSGTDLIVGGTPCQSFSVAGLREGLEDPRGNLALAFCDLVRRARPRWVVWENVPGALSSGGGRDFGSILGALAELGYGLTWRVLDAQHFGVPQRRRRVFLVGYLGDASRAREVLFEPESLRGDPPPSREARKESPRVPGVSFALSAHGGSHSRLDASVETFITFDETQITHPENRSNPQPGDPCHTLPSNGRAPALSHWEGGPHPTLNQSHNTGSPGYSDQELFSQRGGGLVPADGVADPVTANDDRTYTQEGSRNFRLKNCVMAFKPGQSSDSRTLGEQEGVACTLEAGGGGNNHQAITDGRALVRRLTPLECERLQGFPDNWTRIPWKGKPADKCPDGPRYKACGNSMAVPVMRWIGERIQEVDNG